MRTFSIVTLGCKVNQYEAEQIGRLLRSRGLVQVDCSVPADLRVVHTCSLTLEASSKSRQSVRRATRLGVPKIAAVGADPRVGPAGSVSVAIAGPRVVVTGCWAVSDRPEAVRLPGVAAVLGHDDDLAGELDRLVGQWLTDQPVRAQPVAQLAAHAHDAPLPESRGGDRRMTSGGVPARPPTTDSQPWAPSAVKAANGQAPAPGMAAAPVPAVRAVGTRSLPLLDSRQSGRQRAFLKIQDGCDAYCSYCIIPTLRSSLWSKPLDDVVREARSLVAAGHQELVLTGIFLSAYGQPTALRRRQARPSTQPLGDLVEALCSRVQGLRRLRLSSLEPADLNDELIAVLRRAPQVVPHFHLPLQSGSDRLLRRMNRQYSRDDFLRMVQRVREGFDRPALTTDIIVGFPGEGVQEFQETLDVVEQARFIHIHAFPYSPRPGTAAARWTRDFVHGPVVSRRTERLGQRACDHSVAFRTQFLGETVEVLVERASACDHDGAGDVTASMATDLRHGRCAWYFPVFFEGPQSLIGRAVRVRIDLVTRQRTLGTLVGETL